MSTIFLGVIVVSAKFTGVLHHIIGKIHVQWIRVMRVSQKSNCINILRRYIPDVCRLFRYRYPVYVVVCKLHMYRTLKISSAATWLWASSSVVWRWSVIVILLILERIASSWARRFAHSCASHLGLSVGTCCRAASCQLTASARHRTHLEAACWLALP